MKLIRILLMFGGESSEHDVSVASARNVYAALDNQKYDIDLCYISRTGEWQTVEDIEQLEGAHAALVPALGKGYFESDGRKISPDVLLPILHGTNGEDGAVQGLAQLLHIPIVGCGILGSAVCMDKEVAKRLLRAAGIAVADYVVYRTHEQMPDFAHVTLQLGNPIFVKPASQGSSVGVSKVYDEAGFKKAIAEAGRYDRKIIIEKMAHGREIECSVLGNAHPAASPVGEIKPGEDFYSYDDKYAATSDAQVIVPADIPEDVAHMVRETAVKAYRVLECRGLSRVDFFVDGDAIIVNEINTLPGFTNISMYPKLWQHAGLSYSQLVDRLIELALDGDDAKN
jgi:D-alanine-D-alanine ligase